MPKGMKFFPLFFFNLKIINLFYDILVVYESLNLVLHLVTDQVPAIGFSGDQNQPKKWV